MTYKILKSTDWTGFLNKIDEFFDGIKGKKIAICGIGNNNVPVALQFASHGAVVTACDRRWREELGDTARVLESAGISLCLGESYLDSLCEVGADMILRTPGMQPFLPQFDAPRSMGIEITSDMDIFFRLCPAPIVAVTGSDGKTTTSTVIAGMLEEAGYNVHLGGNIGRSLLPEIDSIDEKDRVVVELSSFQLIDMKHSPHIAVVTNVSPNHLDWHTDMEEYIVAKKNIIAYQNENDRAVLNADNDTTLVFAQETAARVFWFSHEIRPEIGPFIENGAIYFAEKDEETFIINTADIALPGVHNIENYMAAFAAVWGSVSPAIMEGFAKEFAGVAHRCEFVRETNGVKWYNDSIGSSPSRTIAGLKAFEQKVILIAGGYDKNIPYDPLGVVAADTVSHAVLLGATADKIEQSIKKYSGDSMSVTSVPVTKFKTLDDAVKFAEGIAKNGDVVLFSPASASFDMYKNFEERGNHFKALVNAL